MLEGEEEYSLKVKGKANILRVYENFKIRNRWIQSSLGDYAEIEI